jgi:hypothetical protein
MVAISGSNPAERPLFLSICHAAVVERRTDTHAGSMLPQTMPLSEGTLSRRHRADAEEAKQ